VSLINRAGTMVIPFLSLYLTGNEGMTLPQVGWVMSAFGLGSLVGSWAGGRLSDKVGFYPTMLWSMLAPGLLFFLLQYVHSFLGFCVAIFLVMSVADTFRPAMFVAIRTYSKPENRTRSVTLVRLAVNLGFSVGPAVGGWIIAKMGYASLFWVDGITCVLAGLVILFFLPKQEAAPTTVQPDGTTSAVRSPYRDRTYIVFLVTVFLIGFVFLQCFSSIPLYYRDVHALSEQAIGLLLGLNGILIFFTEMPLIKYSEERKWNLVHLLTFSAALMGLSYLILNVWHHMTMLIASMVLITVAEMFYFPIANRITMDRADGGQVGAYMGLYTISFSFAHITGHNGGLFLVDRIGYDNTWYVMEAMMLLATAILLWLHKRLLHPPA
jgi:predicted MFS family arabinose efflux permease